MYSGSTFFGTRVYGEPSMQWTKISLNSLQSFTIEVFHATKPDCILFSVSVSSDINCPSVGDDIIYTFNPRCRATEQL